MTKVIKFKIDGIHCKSCKILLESELGVIDGVKEVIVDHISGKSKVVFDNDKVQFYHIKKAIQKLNYSVSGESETEEELLEEKKGFFSKKNLIAGLAAVIFISLLTILPRLGGFELLSALNEKEISVALVFLIGLLASVHCVGMCGGLVVAYSAHGAQKESSRFRPHLQYNAGRFISYTVIGAILGGIGSFFGVNPSFSGFVMLGSGALMILMSLSLFTNFKWLEAVKLRTPEIIARYIYGQKQKNNPKGPFIIGLLNGFMPCGPLQAMQLFALGTGSFVQGAISMGVYSLGTIPLMLGFGTFVSAISSKHIKKTMKISAAVVMLLGLIMINRGLVNFGYGAKSFSSGNKYVQDSTLKDADEVQTIKMDLTYRGYQPNVLYIKKGIPVRWVINVKEMSGCTDAIKLHGFNIEKDLVYGENVIEFLPSETGEIRFSCWMNMVWGKFVVN